MLRALRGVGVVGACLLLTTVVVSACSGGAAYEDRELRMLLDRALVALEKVSSPPKGDDAALEKTRAELQGVRRVLNGRQRGEQRLIALEAQIEQLDSSILEVERAYASGAAARDVLLQQVDADLAALVKKLKELKVAGAAPGSTSVDLAVGLAWPVFAFLLIAALCLRPVQSRLETLLSPLSAVRLPGFEVLVKENASRRIEHVFQQYRDERKALFDRWVDKEELSRKFAIAMQQVEGGLALASSGERVGFRATVHVDDYLFADTYYQLLDYWPAGGGRGRTFSVRYGIVGRSRRAGRSFVYSRPVRDDEELVLEWAMTEDEVRERGEKPQSFGCVVLRDGVTKNAVGYVYLDSHPVGVFGEDGNSTFAAAVEAACGESGLTASLAIIRSQVLVHAPRLKVHNSGPSLT